MHLDTKVRVRTQVCYYNDQSATYVLQSVEIWFKANGKVTGVLPVVLAPHKRCNSFNCKL